MNVSSQEFDALLADCSLSLPAKNILYRLRRHQNPQTGQCNPKRETLAKEICVSQTTARVAIAELKSAGWIGISRTGRSSSYRILRWVEVRPSDGRIPPIRWADSAHRDGAPPYSSERRFLKEGRKGAAQPRFPPSRKKPNIIEQQRELYLARAAAQKP